MFSLNRLSLKTKLQLMMLIASLGSIVAISYLCWAKTRSILTEQMFAQLTSIRTAKATEIETYFQNIQAQIITLSENPTLTTATVEFTQGFQKLEQEKIPTSWEQAIATYYYRYFLPHLAKNIDYQPFFATYRPISPPARYLQYQYLLKTPQNQDNSQYSQTHARYQTFLQNLLKRHGYENLLLIDADNGDIVYSVNKNVDFATNVYTGSHRYSSLGEVVQQVRNNPEASIMKVADFQFYRAAYNVPTAFLATSIYEGSRRVGILAIQLSAAKIDQLLTGERNEQDNNLGTTRETYLVGSDNLLRSQTQTLRRNPPKYAKILQESGLKSEIIAQITRLQNPILLHPIETKATEAIFQGRSGTDIITGYSGDQMLTSYAPLNIANLNWGIITEMSLSEIEQPITQLQNYLLLVTAIIISLVTLYTAIAASRFLKPLERTIDHSRQILTGQGQPQLLATQAAGDELNSLGQIFNDFIGQINQKNNLIEQKNQENERLIQEILPQTIANRWKKGETHIIDRTGQVTVIYLRILGLNDSQNLENLAEGFNELIDILEEKSRSFDVQRLQRFSDRYLAVCGLTKPYLDHVKRAVDFAQESLKAVKTINRQYNLSLSLKIGIDTGTVTTALISPKLRYDLWGEPAQVAVELAEFAETNTILVTTAVRERVVDLFAFESGKTVTLENKSTLSTWILGKTGLQELITELTLGLNFDEAETTL
jgi:class 3 adenylate cyclase